MMFAIASRRRVHVWIGIAMLLPLDAVFALTTGAPTGEGTKASAVAPKKPPVANSRVVKFFATVRDKTGRLESAADVRIQSDGSDSVPVGAAGAKLTVSASKPTKLTLIVPGFRCDVTLDPASGKDGAITLNAVRREGGADCSVQESDKAK
jgi:hypothetical protein